MESNKFSAVFIGEQGVLISCAEEWLAAGHSIVAIASDNAAIQSWCQTKDITCLPWTDSTESTLLTTPCDYLFSLANLRIISDALISVATTAAINFHDGPLPDYSGVNTPSWAIINGEPHHAISFHRMTGSVDQGEVLIHKSFALTDESTSLTANANCFELAISAFKELVASLPGKSSSAPTRSTTQRTNNHYTKGDRPALAGSLDWNNTALQLDRLVRALDFGSYDNPICTAKVWNGSSLLYVGQSKLIDVSPQNQPCESQPGTVISVSHDAITVCCTDATITLSKLTNSAGQPVHGEALAQFVADANSKLPTFAPLSSADQQLIATAANNEAHWKARLATVSPLALPYLSDTPEAFVKSTYKNAQQIIPNFESQLKTMAVIVAYFSRLTENREFDVGIYMPFAEEYFVQHIVQSILPVSITIANDVTVATLAHDLATRLTELQQRGPYLQDLELRQNSSSPKHKVTFHLENNIAENSLYDGLINSDLHVSISADGQFIDWALNTQADSAAVATMQSQLAELFSDTNTYNTDISKLNLLPASDLDQLHNNWNNTAIDYQPMPVHTAFENAVSQHPDRIAFVFESESVTYRELNHKANQLAQLLIDDDLTPRKRVGVLMDRSIDMVVALLAILKTGCAYVPLDPTYPVGRLAHMVNDAGLALILCDDHLKNFLNTGQIPVHVVDSEVSTMETAASNPNVGIAEDALAYVIYTSGSTGLPKGVMVEHRNVANFFVAMDETVKPPYETWLAVTSISFDISVLEIFWTLARGFKVVLYSDERRQKSQSQVRSQYPDQSIDLSLFYWNVAEEESLNRSDKYRLLLEGAQFADQNGFAAVWNPERHFAAFGGSFPNPAVTCAAIAATTKNIHIRAGSCVAPLHSPIRIAEDWSVIDNLSNGRVGVAFASGWAPPDFAILPGNFKNAKTIMFDHLEKVRQLWRGETVDFDGPNGTVAVRTLPRPIQKELPVWITTAGNIESYRSAGTMGANILTHLLGQSIEDVQEKATAYHEAWKLAGHKGRGRITVMLHTFVGESKDAVKAIVHQPMKQYLKSAMFLVKAAAWNFPTFKKLSDESGTSIDSYFDTMSEEELDALLEFAFDRYFETSGLFGSVDDAAAMIDTCKSHGVDEVACLIDFGVDDQQVLDHLPYLAQLRTAVCDSTVEETHDYTIDRLIKQHRVTHLQCTPSMASMLVSDDDSREALKDLTHLLVGGEALPDQLAKDLANTVNGSVSNMYGPTETTIWSSTTDISRDIDKVTIGRPIANTQIYIIDKNAELMPHGLAGELAIGGDGVVRGYHNNQALTDERFIKNPFSDAPNAKMYRTGDLAMYAKDGSIVYLGRLDHQVKLHGYRIELGEIESALSRFDFISQAAVIVREDTPNDRRIVAYLVTTGVKPDAEELKERLKETLPQFMLPSTFVSLPALPLTPNGKIDRNGLPKPTTSTKRTATKTVVAPENDIEVTIADCWKQTLGIEAVGRNENFFDIGGNSILLLDVLARLNKQVAIPQKVKITDVFRYSTVEALAGYLSKTAQPATPANNTTPNISTTGTDRAGSRRAAMNRRRRPGTQPQNQTAP